MTALDGELHQIACVRGWGERNALLFDGLVETAVFADDKAQVDLDAGATVHSEVVDRLRLFGTAVLDRADADHDGLNDVIDPCPLVRTPKAGLLPRSAGPIPQCASHAGTRCVVDADCAWADPCRVGTCDDGVCVEQRADDGTACDVGLPGTCAAGACIPTVEDLVLDKAALVELERHTWHGAMYVGPEVGVRCKTVDGAYFERPPCALYAKSLFVDGAGVGGRGQGPAPGGDGPWHECVADPCIPAGGSHGGAGGGGGAQDCVAPYDDSELPTQVGMPGEACGAQTAGAGGAAMRFVVEGGFWLDSTIDVTGGGDPDPVVQGGAGGSVFVIAGGGLFGPGAIDARGGQGTEFGGGGGHVAIHGPQALEGGVDVSGGYGDAGSGEVGTVYLSDGSE